MELDVQIEAEDIAIDHDYVDDCMSRASSITPLSDLPFFSFTSLPAEIRIMVVDELVLSTLSMALASRDSVKKRVFSWEAHETWLVALETLKNAVAADLDFAAQVFDSTYRLWPKSKDGRQDTDDVGLSELIHAIRFQLCESHGSAMLDAQAPTLTVFTRKPVLVNDLYKLAPGPDDKAQARDAWTKLYAAEKVVVAT